MAQGAVHYGSIETKAGVPIPERLKLTTTGWLRNNSRYKPDEASTLINVTTAIGVSDASRYARTLRSGLSVSEYTDAD